MIGPGPTIYDWRFEILRQSSLLRLQHCDVRPPETSEISELSSDSKRRCEALVLIAETSEVSSEALERTSEAL